MLFLLGSIRIAWKFIGNPYLEMKIVFGRVKKYLTKECEDFFSFTLVQIQQRHAKL